MKTSSSIHLLVASLLAFAASACGTRPGAGFNDADRDSDADAGDVDVVVEDVDLDIAEVESDEAEGLDSSDGASDLHTPDTPDTVDNDLRPEASATLTCGEAFRAWDYLNVPWPSLLEDPLNGAVVLLGPVTQPTYDRTEAAPALTRCLYTARSWEECGQIYYGSTDDTEFERCVVQADCYSELTACELEIDSFRPGSCDYVEPPQGAAYPGAPVRQCEYGLPLNSPRGCPPGMACAGIGTDTYCRARCIPGECEQYCRGGERCIATTDGFGICSPYEVSCDAFPIATELGTPCTTDLDCDIAAACRPTTKYSLERECVQRCSVAECTDVCPEGWSCNADFCWLEPAE